MPHRIDRGVRLHGDKIRELLESPVDHAYTIATHYAEKNNVREPPIREIHDNFLPGKFPAMR